MRVLRPSGTRALFGARVAVSLLLCGVAVAGSVHASFGAAGPLTVSPVTWDVLGLDSNNVNTGPNAFPVGVKVCNTGSDDATSVVATWSWKTAQNSFTAPADGATVSVGTMAAGSCRQVFFEVTLNRSASSRRKSRDYQITLTGDGGLSTAGTQRTLYVQPLVSQNRNTTKKLAGPGGCNLAYTVCDPAPINLVVGRTYTYKFYAETSTAYKQIETYVTFPTSAVQVVSTSATYSNPSGAASSSLYGNACGWDPVTRACVGPANISGGKAGGRVVITYVVKAVAVGSGTLKPVIYDFSGASYHYNADHDSFSLSSGPLTVRYELASTIAGNGKVTSAPAGTLTDGTSSGLDCGGTGTTCSVGHGSGTSVTLTATPLGADTFVGWSGGGCSGASTTCTVTMDQSRSVTATFTGVSSYLLSTLKTGSGTVTADSGAVSCGSTCAGNYASGTLVTLTAAPSTGWTFDGWSGEGCSGTASCQVTMSQARTVTASFSEQSYPLDVTVSGNGIVSSDAGIVYCGNGNASCSDVYGSGQLVTLTATPGSGQSLSSWSGACSGSASTCVVTMSQARSVTAAFTGTAIFSLDVATAGSGTGTVTSSVGGINCGSTCSATYTDGTLVTLTAAAGGGSSFSGWSGDCSGTSTTCQVTMSQARDVTATFGLPQTLTVTKAGAGSGTVTSSPSGVSCGSTCSANFGEGTLVTLTATQAAGSAFTGWSGDCTGSTATCQVTMSQARAVTATFALAYTLAVTKSGTGSGTVGADSGALSCGATCSDSYASGALVTLTASASVGSRFTGWSGDCSGSSTTCQVTMSQARSVTATFVAVWTLSVSKSGAGSGTVSSSVGAISCGATCSDSFDNGTSVTLAASPSAGSRFAGWSGAGCSGTGTCVVSMTQARSVAASFAPVWTLSVSKGGSGSGSVASDVGSIACGSTCADSYDDGTLVTLSPSASPGSRFAGWSGACSGTGTCAVTMTQARAVTATFTAVWVLSISRTGSGSVTSDAGSISCGSTCTDSYDDGTPVTLSASASGGSRFTGWSGSGCSGTSTCMVTMSAARSVTATFVAVWTLSVSKSGAGSGSVSSGAGSISCGATCSDSYDDGTSVTLSASASAGSRFAGWSGAGCSGTGTCVVSMTQARSVSASFVLVWSLSVSKVGSGSVTTDLGSISCGATCVDSYDDGTSVTLTASAAAGSRFAGWSGAGCSGTSTCVVSMTQARSVTASFVLVWALTVSKTGSGSVLSDVGSISCGATCTDSYDDGTVVTLTASASAGSRFTGWSGDCSGSSSSCQVTMGQARSATATFVPVWTLSVAKNGSGTVTSDVGSIACGSTCSDSYDDGTPVTLTASPSAGSRFAGWSGAGCTGTSTCGVTMTQARAVTATFVPVWTLWVTRGGSGSGSVSADSGAVSCGTTCSDFYDDGTAVTLTSSPSAGSRFAGWSGGGCSGTSSCVVSMTQARAVTATFTPVWTLTVSTVGAGSAISDLGAIVCGSTCSDSYDDGTVVTLTASASAGSRFTGWSGDCSGSSSSCQVTMGQVRSVTATFVPVWTLSVAGSGSGTVTSSIGSISCGATCSDSYDDGTTVTLSAPPSAGSRFAGWSGAGCSGTGTCVVSMTQARSVTATFVTVWSLSVATTGSGSVASSVGSIGCGATCTDVYDDGTLVTLTATPSIGFHFSGWSGGGCSGTGTCAVAMTAARSVSASFLPEFLLQVTRQGPGSGTVSGGAVTCGLVCSYTYTAGSIVTLSATPLPGSQFGGWSGAGCSGTGACTVTMDQARSVIATFAALEPLAPRPVEQPVEEPVEQPVRVDETRSVAIGNAATWPLRLKIAGSGSIRMRGSACAADCRSVHDDGTTLTLVAAHPVGWRFAGWSGACAGAAARCRVTMSEARTVTATFVRAADVTLRADGHGVISGALRDCRSTCARRLRGATVLRAKPKPGYWFAGWSGACSGKRHSCMVRPGAAGVVAHFRRLLELKLHVTSGYVFHSPYEKATASAVATWRGRPLAGVPVHVRISCPLAHVGWHTDLQTGALGRASYRFGTDIPNRVRVAACAVHASVAAHGKIATEERPATVRFIHPLWLKTMGRDAAGHIRVRIWGRAGDRIELRANRLVVARATLPRSGWVEVAPAWIRHGTYVSVTGLHGHRSHTIVA